MRLALDAMGGDHAPGAMVEGGFDYARAYPQQRVVLVGVDSVLSAELERILKTEGGERPANLDIEHAPEVITMADGIGAIREKPHDSINRCAQIVKAGEADGVVYCGNTGCSGAAAQLHFRCIPGIKRAGIINPLPTLAGVLWLMDAGFNSACKPEHLVQFAEMGSVFLEHYAGHAKPRIAVLSNGSEDTKGDELTYDALRLLRQTPLNVVGYVEGNDLFLGNLELAICDGFTGNVLLKTCEGLCSALLVLIRQEMVSNWRTKLAGMLARPVFRRIHRRTHWGYIGGCPLLGVNHIAIIAHGRSDRVAVFHALGQAARCVEGKVVGHMRDSFAQRLACQPNG